MKPESNRPISIEDLLRLKRAELPPAEFWGTFDRELRAKQLAALVEKRPWWQRLPNLFARMARFRVPIGASALLAITFLTVRYYEAPPSAQDVPQGESSVAAGTHPYGSDTLPETAATVVVSVPAAPVVVMQQDSNAVIPAEPAARRDAGLPEVILAGGAVAAEAEREVESPAARYMAANRATVEAASQANARSLLEVATGFEARAMPARAAVEPLQQMTPPSDSRRSRFLTAMVSQASLEASMRTTARAASRIDEERLYDQIQRFGARGDRVNVKF